MEQVRLPCFFDEMVMLSWKLNRASRYLKQVFSGAPIPMEYGQPLFFWLSRD